LIGSCQDPAVVGGVEAEAVRPSTGESAVEQVGHQRVVHRARIAFRSGAVDDGAGSHDAAVGQGHPQTMAFRFGGHYLRGFHPQSLRRTEVAYLFGDSGCHAMPVDFPPPGVLGEEGFLILIGQSIPDSRSHRPEAVDGRTPVTPVPRRRPDVLKNTAPQRTQVTDARQIRRRGLGGEPGRMVTRKQSVARHRMQRPPGPLERQRHVDHREPGAHQQDVVGLRDRGEHPGRPRVRDEPGGGTQFVRRPLGAGREHADREHGRADVQPTTGREPQHDPARRTTRADSPLANPAQSGRPTTARGRFEYFVKVCAEIAPGQVFTGFDPTAQPFTGPVNEIVRITDYGAQRTHWDIQDVIDLRGRIRDPAAGCFRRVH
jgi:hypothetical protein